MRVWDCSAANADSGGWDTWTNEPHAPWDAKSRGPVFSSTVSSTVHFKVKGSHSLMLIPP